MCSIHLIRLIMFTCLYRVLSSRKTSHEEARVKIPKRRTGLVDPTLSMMQSKEIDDATVASARHDACPWGSIFEDDTGSTNNHFSEVSSGQHSSG